MLKRSIFTFLLIVWCASVSSQGLKLFGPEVKDAASYPQLVVMGFLERYFGKELYCVPSGLFTSISTP